MSVNERGPLFGLLIAAVIAAGNIGCGSSAPPVVATQLAISVSANATAGTAVNVTVRAVDATGTLATTYAGTVHFTSSDAQATLPTDSTLTGGTGGFSVTLKTAGPQTISVSDKATTSIAGTSPVVVNPGATTQLTLTAASAETTGIAFALSVSASDAYGNAATGYAGTLHFTSSDAQATLPANATLTSGSASFPGVMLKTIGSQTITATDTVSASLKGTTSAINVVTNAATHISASAPASAQTRATFQFTVSALDAANNVSAGYSGTVHFTSTDAQAKLPADSTLTAGTAQLSATMETSGTQTLSATDTSSASINGSSSISVAATAALALNLNCNYTPGGCTSTTAPPNGAAGNLYYPHVRCFITRCFKMYGFPLTGTGGVPPYTWSWAAASGSSLPPGLNVTNSPNQISGTPTTLGTYNIVLTVTDSGLPSVQTSQNYGVTITPPPPPVVNTSQSQINGLLNQPSSYTFTANGNSLQPPYTWSETGALPPGLAFANSGTLSGTPTQTGSFPISVTATDQFNQTSAAANFTVVVTTHGFLLTGSMATPRRFHTATLLPNGKVLVAGGEDASYTAVASAELYDPSTGTFSATGNMTVARAEHTATLLNTGKVLITGGDSGSTGTAAVSSAELYDPSTGTFTVTPGSMTAARVSHTATLLQNGKVLIAGGDVTSYNSSGQSLASAEIFDPSTGTFAATGNMTVPRESHTATLLSSGKVLIAGGSDGTLGYTATSTLYASSETFDPSTGQFTAAGMMTKQRLWQTANLLASGKVLVAGGIASAPQANGTADLFDTTSGNFAATGNMTEPRFYQASSTLNDGTVLISGGSDTGTRAKATAEIYDPTAATFAATGSMSTVRVWHTSTVLQSGKVLITGGSGSNSVPMATAEVYQ